MDSSDACFAAVSVVVVAGVCFCAWLRHRQIMAGRREPNYFGYTDEKDGENELDS